MFHEKLIIGEADKCGICGKDFKYRFQRWVFPNTPEGLTEIKIKTEHPACLSILRKIHRLKNEINDLEISLFCK